jgi:hypothetical protein
VERVWGSNLTVRRILHGTCGDLALIQQRLISLAVIANKTFHLWLTTSFYDAMIIPPDEGLDHHLPPQGYETFSPSLGMLLWQSMSVSHYTTGNIALTG